MDTRRTELLDVPGMKELMRNRPEESLVGLRVFQEPSRPLNNRGVQVLCAAARIGACMNQKKIAAVGHIAEKVGLRFDDLREVGLELIGIVLCATRDGKWMWIAVELELQEVMQADFQRRIDENVVIGRE